MRDGTQKPEWTKSLARPALVLMAMMMVLSLMVAIPMTRKWSFFTGAVLSGRIYSACRTARRRWRLLGGIGLAALCTPAAASATWI